MHQVTSRTIGDVQVELAYEDQLYYASAVNGRNFIKSLVIRGGTESTHPESANLEVVSLGVALTGSWSRTWSRSGSGQETKFDSDDFSELTWNASALWEISERQPVEIQVHLPGFSSEPILFPAEISSPRTWIYSSEDSYSLLAAFVQPNHPSLRPILDVAVRKLQERGQAPQLSGYQSLQHLPHMVQAIYDAVCDLSLTYSNPPASWGDGGQKIREPQLIVDEKVGTCLDTALLFAGLLENVGLKPVVMMVPGHAFVGYWADEKYGLKYEATAVRDVVSAIEAGLIQLFETTVVCQGPGQKTFDQALLGGRTNVMHLDLSASTNPADESVLVDIALCRSLSSGARSIMPIPARVLRPDGSVEVVEYKPEELSIARLIEQVNEAVASHKVAAKGIDSEVPPRLKHWLDDLLDLSLNNPLINFKRPARSLSLVSPVGAVGTVEDLLHQGVEFNVRENIFEASIEGDRGNAVAGAPDAVVADALSKKILVSNHPINDFMKRARAVTSEAKSFFEETGSNGLYLALGSLVWVPEGKKEIRSPLILVPVHLTPKARSTQFILSLDTASDITPNFSLAEKLRRELGLKLEDLVNLKEDDSGIDVAGTFQHIRERLTEAKLEGFRVDENAVLGFFDFSTYRLWRDLVDNWRQFEKNPLVKHLIYTPNDAFQDPNTDVVSADLDELIAELPIEADSSQVNAVAQALAGKTFIMQGPPGTGKSQTITNMLARALNDGKRVLFVAEKKDALDVVVDRLESSGLRPFVLDLHDKGMSFKAVKEQLSSVVDLAISADHVGFDAAVRDYAQAIAPLQKYRDELHAVGNQGESLSTALDKLLAVNGEATIEVPGPFVATSRPQDKQFLFETAIGIAEIGSAAGTVKSNPWSLVSRSTPLSAEELSIVRKSVATISSTAQALSPAPEALAYIKGIENLSEFPRLEIVRFGALSPDAIAVSRGGHAREARRMAIQSIFEMLQLIESAPGSYKNLPTLGVESLLQQANLAATAFMGGVKLGKIVKLANQTMGWSALKDKTTVLADLTALVAIEKRARRVESELLAVPGIRVPSDLNPYSADELRSIRGEIARLEEVSTFVEAQHADGSSGESFVNAVNQGNLADQIISFSQAVTQLFEVLTHDAESLTRWQGGRIFGSAIIDSVSAWQIDTTSRDLMELTRWVGLLEAFGPFRQFGLNDIATPVIGGEVSYDELPSAFLRGYYTSLLELLMVQRGFHNFDGVQVDSYVKRLKDAQLRLRKELPDILAERLFDRRGFDASSRLGAIGDLLVVLSQQRAPKGVGVRSLLRKFWDVITRMTPCVLASPDSTVRFIAPELEAFDLVVFDEASQIRVAHSLGAIGRGKAAVIAGDTKQMPPTSVAKVSNDGVDADEPEDEDDFLSFTGDAESILSQCAVSRVPEIMLNWHYRSEDESLIAFSNSKYYDRKLLSFPSPDSSRETKGLSFDYISDGIFIRPGMTGNSPKGTNLAEATAIVSDIARRAADEVLSDDSVGIVTFNIQQRDLIESMLLDSKDPNIQRALIEGLGGEEIFVKNLESVQGKERDVILFSVAFSKNEKGEVPLNFGPLNNTGGQRRLNVAITRARKQVKVFCSFMPSELLKRNPGSIGVRHLAEFLKMASEGAESNPALFAETGVRTDRFRGQIVESLRNSGFIVKEDVGLSGFKIDIALFESQESDKAVMGILLDGSSWNERQTVVDRDVLPANVLVNKMAWPAVERIWLPAWLRDKDGEIERLKTAFASAVEESKKPRPRKAKPKLALGAGNNIPDSTEVSLKSDAPKKESGNGSSLSRATRTTSTGDVVDALQQYLLTQTPFFFSQPEIYGPQSTLDLLFDKNVVATIRGLADKLTSIEGPVSAERLGKYVGACYSFSRMASSRIEDINKLAFPGHSRDSEGFIFPAGIEPSNFIGWKFSIEDVTDSRVIDEISLQEIGNAAVALCQQFQGISPDDLSGKILPGVFLIQRVTPRIKSRLDEGIDLAVAQGLLIESAGYLKIS